MRPAVARRACGGAVRTWLARIGLGFSSALLMACAHAPLPPPSAATRADHLSGRIAVQVEGHGDEMPMGQSAEFDWLGNASAGQLTLTSVLGVQLAKAQWNAQGATLQTPTGLQRFAGLDELSQAAFGEPMPLHAWPHWLKGEPSPTAPYTAWPDGTGFDQAGWAIDTSGLAWRSLIRLTRHAAPQVRVTVRLG